MSEVITIQDSDSNGKMNQMSSPINLIDKSPEMMTKKFAVIEEVDLFGTPLAADISTNIVNNHQAAAFEPSNNIIILSSPEPSPKPPASVVISTIPKPLTVKESIANFCQILKSINCDGTDKLEAID